MSRAATHLIRVRTALVGAVTLALLAGAGACKMDPEKWKHGREGKEAKAEEQALPVLVGPVGRGEIEAAISAASTIEAERQVTVHAESTGRILSLSVEEGDTVKKGQLIARIRYEAQSSGLDRAESSLEEARSDYENLKSLYARNAVSKEELDAARVAYNNAQLDVRDRRRDVANTRVVIPFSGTVTERFVNEGAYIASGQQLVSVVDFDSLVARVFIPEKELDRIKVGQPASIVGKAARGRKGVGTVKRIAPIVDATTGTVKLTVSLPPELAGGDNGFLPGMYAEVTLTTEKHEDAVLVPKQAVVYDEEQAFVFVTDGSRVKRVGVKPGFSDGERTEILEGVQPGTEIVVAGQSGLKDGALIRRVDAAGNPLEPDPSGDKDTAELANGSLGEEADSAAPEGA